MHRSIAEQVLNNGGNFVFFIVSANLAGSEEFGEFAVLWAAMQLILAVAIQWILLPISSVERRINTDSLLASSRHKFLVTAAVSPLPIWAYLEIMNLHYDSAVLLMVWLGAAAMVVNEVYRYLVIRLGKINNLLVYQLAKWIIAFSLLYVNFYVVDPLGYNKTFVAITCTFIVLSLIVVSLYWMRIWRAEARERIYLRSYSAPLLTLGMVTNVQTVTVTYVLSQISLSLYGALQAFRSIANFLPLILQFLETHVSAHLVKTGERGLITDYRILLLLLVFMGVAQTFFVIFYETIVSFIYGQDFIAYGYVLPIVVALVLIQSLGRLISIDIRLSGETKIFNVNSVVMVASVGALCALYWFGSSVAWIFGVLIMAAGVQTSTLMIRLWRKR